jgi:hypothetical protein
VCRFVTTAASVPTPTALPLACRHRTLEVGMIWMISDLHDDFDYSEEGLCNAPTSLSRSDTILVQWQDVSQDGWRQC